MRRLLLLVAAATTMLRPHGPIYCWGLPGADWRRAATLTIEERLKTHLTHPSAFDAVKNSLQTSRNIVLEYCALTASSAKISRLRDDARLTWPPATFWY